MHSLKYVVIGVGAGIFKSHRRALESLNIEIAAVSDVSAETGQQQADELGCPFYSDHQKMLAEIRPDVAIILTPHPFHADLAVDCFEAGCHVLTEKPMAVQVADADRMNEAAAQAGKLLAVNFQQRFRPEIRAVKQLIQQGKLGDIQHVEMTALWTRTIPYFEERKWRGTWAGEGGGVLMNQASHDLDLLCHLAGVPDRVYAWTMTLTHHIETEDTVQAMLRWDNGATATFHTSTAEAGPPNRIEIWGTKGFIQIIGNEPLFHQYELDVHEHIRTNPDPYSKVPGSPQPVILDGVPGDHLAVYRHFNAAIVDGAPLMIDGISARGELEVANAIILSGQMRREVTLPLDRDEYAAFLAEATATHSPQA